jgi:CDP-diglyceride synthetase
MLFASKLLIGSDSRNISILSAESTSTRILGIYKFAYDIAITLHLFSLFVCILILFLIPAKRYLSNRNKSLSIDQYTIHILSSILIWNSLSAIAYIGSNGRYTYALSILSLVLYLSHKGQQQVKIDKNE